jgi:hypothetical protein
VTGPEAIALLKLQIEAMFPAVRQATTDEKQRRYAEFMNGYGAGARWRPTKSEDIIEHTLKSVSRRFSHHATERLIWRVEPEYNERGDIYCRLGSESL